MTENQEPTPQPTPAQPSHLDVALSTPNSDDKRSRLTSRHHSPRPSHNAATTFLNTAGPSSFSFTQPDSSISTLGSLTHDSWSTSSRALSPWNPPKPWVCRHNHVHLEIDDDIVGDLCPTCRVCMSANLPDALSLLDRLQREHKGGASGQVDLRKKGPHGYQQMEEGANEAGGSFSANNGEAVDDEGAEGAEGIWERARDGEGR